MGNTSTIVIAIGRNVDGLMMPDRRWFQFRDDVDGRCYRSGLTVIQRPALDVGDGQLGVWEGEVEGAATWILLDFQGNPDEVEALRQDLDIIRDRYDQDAIAFIVADGTDNII